MSPRGRIMQIWTALIAAPLLLAAVYPLQRRIDAESRAIHPERDELILRSPRLLKELSLGYEALLADIYWTRTMQYYGSKRRDRDPHLDSLWPLLDLTTTLDPHLIVAYKFGAVFLAEPPPRGAGRPDLAVELTRCGIANNPGEWRFWADLGFIYYWNMRDYKKASEAYLEGGKRPHALPWMQVMAAKIAEEGQSLETSYFLWKQVFDTTADPTIRKNAQEHLQALLAEEDVRRLDGTAAQFEHRSGRFPNSIRELVYAGMLRGVPLDPAGYPYELGPRGKVRLNPSSPIKLEILKTTMPH